MRRGPATRRALARRYCEDVSETPPMRKPLPAFPLFAVPLSRKSSLETGKTRLPFPAASGSKR